MAHVTGGNLATLLGRAPRPPIEEVRRIVREIADALEYAHERGVVHRDIKPDNILLDADGGRAMVTDFGIARAIEAGSRLTVTGIAVGTPAYMSPEQAMGEREVDGRSDIYSLGVVAYQMLTGRLPFTGSNPMALLLKHVNERPKPIADLRPDAPKAMREAVERCLMKDREDRWETAGALRDALSATDLPAAWRSEHREPVRYTSPRRGSPAADNRVALAVSQGGPVISATRSGKPIVMEPEHLASLTRCSAAQDLRLWHGRINLFDRIKTMRRYTWFTAALMLTALGGLAEVEEFPPLILGPLFPIYMSVKAWRRGKSLRLSGLKVRQVLLMPRAEMVLPRRLRCRRRIN
jgi:serine/threonine protein kinase